MRIIAGSRKGARIFAPKGTETRPTGDRVREAAFNLIGPGRVEEARVLDLFAGSGAMGLEALSRGAAHATFVEADRAACQTINRNLDKLELEGATVLCQDALTALRGDARMGSRYDLVLVDPPVPEVFFPAKRADSTLARGSRDRAACSSSRPRPARSRTCRRSRADEPPLRLRATDPLRARRCLTAIR